MMTREKLQSKLSERAEIAQTRLTSWAKQFAENPAYALSLSKDMFGLAANLAVATEILGMLRTYPEVTVELVLEQAHRNMLRGARDPSFSTSPTSNLMAHQTTAAWAALVEMLQD